MDWKTIRQRVKMENYIAEINQNLNILMNKLPDSAVKEAMVYALNGKGKRIRPLIFIATLNSLGVDYRKYLDIACSIEMIHTYSLIHDDLPGMDNDDYRRGRLTCHKVYGESIAILAGDSLLNEACRVIIANSHLNATVKLELIDSLYHASGINGMILGQEIDILNENSLVNIDILNNMHKLKTGALIAVSFKMAALIANVDYVPYQQAGYDLGLAFQIQDDILDVVGQFEKLGKPVGSDIDNNKSTYVSLMGIEKSRKKIDELFDRIDQFTTNFDSPEKDIEAIVNLIKGRDH